MVEHATIVCKFDDQSPRAIKSLILVQMVVLSTPEPTGPEIGTTVATGSLLALAATPDVVDASTAGELVAAAPTVPTTPGVAK